MDTVRDEIRRAIIAASATPLEMRELPDAEAEPICRQVVTHFVTGNRRWWWEGFGSDAVSLRTQQGWTRITELVPEPDALVWFIAEGTPLPFNPVFEATPRTIQNVLGECFGFEYYLVAKDKSWILCENHHDCLIR